MLVLKSQRLSRAHFGRFQQFYFLVCTGLPKLNYHLGTGRCSVDNNLEKNI